MAEKSTITLDGEVPGKIDTYFISDSILYLDIDINSKRIPDTDIKLSGNTWNKAKTLCINYCFEGRCELQLLGGERTFLGHGEIALDIGHTVHANDTYLYPNAKYDGIEIFIKIPQNNEITHTQDEISMIESLFRTYLKKDELIITKPSEQIRMGVEMLRADTLNQVPSGILKIDIIRIVYLLSIMDYEQIRRRGFLTKSQVNIAEYVKDAIEKDLSKRCSAKSLADILNVSETSLKNYFREVYGQGYMEYQKTLRMEFAAKELCESRKTVGEIATQCGYQNQSRFAKAFKEFYGISPKEYARKIALKRNNNIK